MNYKSRYVIRKGTYEEQFTGKPFTNDSFDLNLAIKGYSKTIEIFGNLENAQKTLSNLKNRAGFFYYSNQCYWNCEMYWIDKETINIKTNDDENWDDADIDIVAVAYKSHISHPILFEDEEY